MIKGDIHKALGISIVQLNDHIEIDFSNCDAEDIVKFQEIPAKAMAGKKKDDFTYEDGMRLQSTYRNYFNKYFLDKDPKWSSDKETLAKFVVQNMERLQRAFTIGFGIKSEAEYDKDIAEAKENQIKKN